MGGSWTGEWHNLTCMLTVSLSAVLNRIQGPRKSWKTDPNAVTIIQLPEHGYLDQAGSSGGGERKVGRFWIHLEYLNGCRMRTTKKQKSQHDSWVFGLSNWKVGPPWTDLRQNISRSHLRGKSRCSSQVWDAQDVAEETLRRQMHASEVQTGDRHLKSSVFQRYWKQQSWQRAPREWVE